MSSKAARRSAKNSTVKPGLATPSPCTGRASSIRLLCHLPFSALFLADTFRDFQATGFTYSEGTIKASSHETHMKINSWSDREILAAHNNFESMTVQFGELVNVTNGTRSYRLKAFANFFFSKDRQFQREILPGTWVIK
jgi:hypothetical protein